jgi:multidrug efflux pump subunit AcrA (membrane-fusion protein)
MKNIEKADQLKLEVTMNKKKLIIAIVVFSVIGAGIFYLLTTGNIGAKYNTVEVTKGEVGKYVQDVGRISSRNIRRYYGSGTGKVEEMTLELGDHVEKGQLLIKYEDNLELEIQRVEKQIEALEAGYNEALSGTDMESVNSAWIEVSRIKKNMELATKNKDITESLYKIGSASLFEFEQAESNVEQLKSSLGIAQNTYNRLTKGISENIREKYEAEIDVLLLTLDILEKNRDNYVIFADIEGIVTEIHTFDGDFPSPGMLIIEIQDPTEKVVLVDFMVEDARSIKPNMEAEIQDWNLDIDMDGLKVDKVYPKAFVTLSELGVEENRQTVEIGLPKSADALAFSLEVETKVMVESPREVLLVPAGAVFQKDSKQYVEVLEDGDAVEREISTGIEVDGSIEVKEGLKEGELVILNYQEE